MTREDLIEWVARGLHVAWEYDDACEFDAASEQHREKLKECARDVAPAVVSFVAEWIASECRKDIDAATCARRWREEMGNG